MKSNYKMNRLLVIVMMSAVYFCAPFSLLAQDAPKQLTRADYDQWERLGRATTVSEDGNWLIYSINKNNGDTELHLHNMQRSAEKVFKYASSPSFSKDSISIA